MKSETYSAFTEDHLEKALVTLGYPGFAHLAEHFKLSSEHEGSHDLTALLRWAVIQDVLDVRLIEGLPWLIAAYAPEIDWNQLTHDVEEDGTQNRLGYLVTLALELLESKHSLFRPEAHRILKESLLRLQAIRRTQEQTLMEEWSGPALRAWMRVNRPREASQWHLLTTLTVNDLQHAE